PTLRISDETELESVGIMAFEVTLSNPSDRQITITLVTGDQSATESFDYTSVSTEITFDAGTTTLTGPVRIPIIDDAVEESDETFTLSVEGSSVSGPLGDHSAVGIGTIRENDSVRISDASEFETEGKLTFVVELASVHNSDITLTLTTTDGDAIAPDDYADTQGIVTFPAGETVGEFEVPIVNDGILELNETLTVSVLSFTGPLSDAAVASAVGTGTIKDLGSSDNPIFSSSAGSRLQGSGLWGCQATPASNGGAPWPLLAIVLGLGLVSWRRRRAGTRVTS
ncbi:MAG: Calx-beta domain-containing protein, partial [Planctomycetota bacterium]